MNMTITMMFDFLNHFMIQAALAGILLGCLCGPMGCFVLWQRLGFLGDTLAHGALVGVSASLLLDLSPFVGVLAITGGLAFLLGQGASTIEGPLVARLSIWAQIMLALGFVGASLKTSSGNLLALLFGDLLAVSQKDLLIIALLSSSGLFFLWRFWNPLLKMTLHEEMAFADGVPVKGLRISLMLMLAFIIAVASQFVGVLMVSSLLLLPAAAARIFSKTPESMGRLAVVFSIVGVLGGLGVSWSLDLPSTPMITLVFAFFWVAGRAVMAFRGKV